MNELAKIPTYLWRLLFAAALVAVFLLTEARAQDSACLYTATGVAKPQVESWVFARSRYTNDPDTGGRVAQYAMKPPIEPLPDPRAITSGYNRTRTVLRGGDGSADTRYRVQSYGNGRGGMDAEWERFHDAWRGSTIGGGNFQTFPPFGFGGGYGAGFGGGYGGGNGGFPGYGPGGFHPPGWQQPDFRGGANYDNRYGPGFGRPDAGRLDPDAADGYYDGRRRTPDREFYNRPVPRPLRNP